MLASHSQIYDMVVIYFIDDMSMLNRELRLLTGSSIVMETLILTEILLLAIISNHGTRGFYIHPYRLLK